VTGDRFGEILPAQPESRIAEDAKEFWSESDRSQRIRDQSHWVGEGRWKDASAWSEIGESHFKMWEQFANLCGSSASSDARRMVEWGPGGGANAVIFSSRFSEFIGIDISESNLTECGRQLDARGYDGFRPVLIQAERPEEAVAQSGGKCDFFLSTAVFQHFPTKNYGAKVLRTACEMLKPGGLALIQIRYDDSNPRFKPKRRDYRTHAITFTSYSLPEFWNLSAEEGFEPRFVELKPAANYAYYYLRKPDPAASHPVG